MLIGTACASRHGSAAPASTAPFALTTTSVATTTTTSEAKVIFAGPPYRVADWSLDLVDRSRPTVSHGRVISAVRSLHTLLWFPDQPGRWPLVVFAHGYDITPGPYVPLLRAWAARGYVVAAPEFPLADPQVAGANLDEADIDNLPGDVRFVTDQLIKPTSPVAGRIDGREVAVAGHSDGAEAVLAAATDPVAAGEPRYRAVIVMSGQPVGGAGGRNPPILVMQGDADTINPPSNGYAVWADAASPKYLLVMRGAGHLPGYEPSGPWWAGVEGVTSAFLDAYVATDRPPASVAQSVAGAHDVSLRAG